MKIVLVFVAIVMSLVSSTFPQIPPSVLNRTSIADTEPAGIMFMPGRNYNPGFNLFEENKPTRVIGMFALPHKSNHSIFRADYDSLSIDSCTVLLLPIHGEHCEFNIEVLDSATLGKPGICLIDVPISGNSKPVSSSFENLYFLAGNTENFKYLNNTRWIIRWYKTEKGTLTITPDTSGLGNVRHAKLFASFGDRKSIFTYKAIDYNDMNPTINYVGDLDNDSIPDLLLYLPVKRTSYGFYLFLSGLAEEGELYGLGAKMERSH
ncbi:hypothetical protein K8I28_02245 [bacterium]|nr:hypothetical protein [bacterium]